MILQNVPVVSEGPPPSDLLSAGLQSVRESGDLWTQAAAALARRDYPEFDRLIALFRDGRLSWKLLYSLDLRNSATSAETSGLAHAARSNSLAGFR